MLTETAKELLLKRATKQGERAVSAVIKFLTERSLFGWVQKQNSDKGLAPSYAALWRQYSKEAKEEPNSLQGEPDAPPAKSWVRKL